MISLITGLKEWSYGDILKCLLVMVEYKKNIQNGRKINNFSKRNKYWSEVKLYTGSILVV